MDLVAGCGRRRGHVPFLSDGSALEVMMPFDMPNAVGGRCADRVRTSHAWTSSVCLAVIYGPSGKFLGDLWLLYASPEMYAASWFLSSMSRKSHVMRPLSGCGGRCVVRESCSWPRHTLFNREPFAPQPPPPPRNKQEINIRIRFR
jgi:hypothetical protein